MYKVEMFVFVLIVNSFINFLLTKNDKINLFILDCELNFIIWL